MRSAINHVVRVGCLAGPLLAALPALNPAAAQAPGFDGPWSVLVITEKGTCDRGYRYEVKVANGKLLYAGDNKVDIDGTVAPGGAVKVSIKLGGQGAQGTGHLSAASGAGIWSGVGSSGACSGRWEAERR